MLRHSLLRGASGRQRRDPYWSYVVLAMHMDGADNGTVFTDLKGHTVTRYGNTVTKTNNKMLGTASAYFDGSGDYLVITDNGDFSMPSDFTVEFYAYGNIFDRITFSNMSKTYLYNGSLNINDVTVVSCPDLSKTNSWKHIAITRSGNTVRVFQQGTIIGSGTYTGTADFTNLNIGRYAPNNNLFLLGYIDDLRITKGIARYTGNFTPPTQPFPDS